MIGHVPRSTAGFAFHAAIWVGVACCGPAATAAQIGTPLFGQAGAALVPGAGAGAAMKQQLPQGAQKMADNFNKAGTADAAPVAGGEDQRHEKGFVAQLRQADGGEAGAESGQPRIVGQGNGHRGT